MSGNSRIEWTEMTWNPVTGCTKVSAGCKNCYALTMAKRLQAMGVRGYENGFEVSLLPDRLQQPLKRVKPTKYFVNSMSDLFHESVPDEFVDSVFEVIARAPHHVFQILTKRHKRLHQYFRTREVPSNAWLGVSVENRRHGLPRIDYLRTIEAKVRFLSIEPLLEDLGWFDLEGMHWVIVGGESGPNARPMKREWVDRIQEQCEVASIPFFFKQWGAHGVDGKRRSKKANGRTYRNQIWNNMPVS